MTTKCSDVMAYPAVSIRQDQDLERAANAMLDRKVGSVVVVDAQGKAVGIVTESDFSAHPANLPYSAYLMPKVLGRYVGDAKLEQIYRDARGVPVNKVMKHNLWTVEENDPIEKAVDIMLRQNVHHVPVLREGKPVGMLAHHDLLRLMRGSRAA